MYMEHEFLKLGVKTALSWLTEPYEKHLLIMWATSDARCNGDRYTRLKPLRIVFQSKNQGVTITTPFCTHTLNHLEDYDSFRNEYETLLNKISCVNI